MTKLAPLHKLPRVSIVDRDSFIVQYCRGKRVLHLGCAARPFTTELFDAGQLLHQKLGKVCAELVGIDTWREGISLLQDRGVKNLFATDGSKLRDIMNMVDWVPDVIVAGEIIEHLDAPGPFLSEYGRHMPSGCTLLITVPNAFSVKFLLHVLLGREKVSTDHVSYYSHATMGRLLGRVGLEIIETRCYRAPGDNRLEQGLDLVLSPLLMFRPFLCDGLVFCCSRVR